MTSYDDRELHELQLSCGRGLVDGMRRRQNPRPDVRIHVHVEG